MANVKLRLSRLEAKYGGALRGEIDVGLMSPNELLDSISAIFLTFGMHSDEAEKQISHLRVKNRGDEKPERFEVQNYRAQSRNYSELSNKELKDEVVRVAAELGITFPDFEII